MNILEHSHCHDFFHGILAIQSGARGLTLRRLTERQMAYYAQSEPWAIRTRCPAGVSLWIQTDSSTLAIECTVEQGARPYFGLDLQVDGAFVHAVREMAWPDGARFSTQLLDARDQAGKMRELRLYLSHSRPLTLHSIVLSDDARVQAVPAPPLKLLCLGDSITQGMDAVSASTTYAVQLARLLNADLLNQGVGGHIFDAGSFDPALPFSPDLITIAYGTNDWNRAWDLATLRARVTAYLTRIRSAYPQVPIVLITPLYRPDYQEPKHGRDLPTWSATIAQVASAFAPLDVVDGFTLIPHHAENYRNPVHPNELGFLHYALNLYHQIQVLNIV